MIPLGLAQFPALLFGWAFVGTRLPDVYAIVLMFTTPVLSGFFWPWAIPALIRLLKYLWWITLPGDMRALQKGR